MALAARTGGRPHGMLSVVGLGDEALQAICSEVRAHSDRQGTVCQLANYLFPTVSRSQGCYSQLLCLALPRPMREPCPLCCAQPVPAADTRAGPSAATSMRWRRLPRGPRPLAPSGPSCCQSAAASIRH